MSGRLSLTNPYQDLIIDSENYIDYTFYRENNQLLFLAGKAEQRDRKECFGKCPSPFGAPEK
jgi:hypothetical protein